ncbi:MAG: M23 family metallopeptidase, partial [Dysgonamonadaceae bacterium]|nr:M23 family metallopeptidase [Dysgonamonadaceae bacterium]
MNRISLIYQPWIRLMGIAFSITLLSPAQAQTPSRNSREKTETLTAEKIKTGLETAVVDSMMVQLESLEGEMYPADALYDSWNTEYIKAYKDVVVPDSFAINVSEFVMPVAGLQRVTSPFGPRKRRFHYGTDLKVQVGDTIYAAFDGKVRVKSYERRGYGYFL